MVFSLWNILRGWSYSVIHWYADLYFHISWTKIKESHFKSQSQYLSSLSTERILKGKRIALTPVSELESSSSNFDRQRKYYTPHTILFPFPLLTQSHLLLTSLPRTFYFFPPLPNLLYATQISTRTRRSWYEIWISKENTYLSSLSFFFPLHRMEFTSQHRDKKKLT